MSHKIGCFFCIAYTRDKKKTLLKQTISYMTKFMTSINRTHMFNRVTFMAYKPSNYSLIVRYFLDSKLSTVNFI